MADKIVKGITVEIGGDTTKLGAALDESDKKSRALSAELGNINKLLKYDEANPELLAQKQQVLTDQIKNTAEKLEMLKEAEAQVQEQFERGEVSQEQIRALQREIIATEGKLDTYRKAAEETAGKIESLGGANKSLSDTVKDQKKELSDLKERYADVAAAQGKDSDEAKSLAAQIKSLSGELKINETSLNAAEQAADKLDATFEKSEKSANSLGNALKSGLTAGAHAASAATQATFSVVKALSTTTLEFAKDAVSTGKDFDKSVSQISATYGYTVEQLTGDLNSMSAAEAASAQKARNDMEMLRDKAQEMGAQTSFSASEAAEGLNILAMSGYDAESACAMIGDVLNLAAAGSLSLADAAKYTSGAVKGFADDTKDAQYYTDLMAKGATLANTDVKALGEALSGGAATAASYGQSAEGLTLALLRMAEQGVTGTQATTSLNRAMADLYTPSDAAAAKLKELGVSAYDADHNARDFNDVVDDLNAALSGMTPEAQNAAKSVIFTSNGLQAFNKMTVTSTEDVNEWSEALKNAAGSAGAQAETMLDNLQGDVTKFGSAMEGAQIVLSDSLTPTLRSFVQLGTKGVSDLTNAFKEEGLSAAIEAIGPILDELIDMISGLLPTVIDIAEELIDALASNIPTLLHAILPPLISALTEILTSLSGMLPTLLGVIADAVPLLIDAITAIAPQLLREIMNLAVSILDDLASVLPNLITTLVSDLLPSLITNFFAYLPDVVDALMQLVTAIGDAIPDIIAQLSAYLPEIIDTILYGIMLSVPTVLRAAISLFGAILDAVPVLLRGLTQALPLIVDSITGWLLDSIPALIDCVILLTETLAESLPEIITAITDVLPTLIDGIIGTLLEMLPALVDCGITLLCSLVDALPVIISAVCAALPALIDGIVSALILMLPQLVQCGITLLTALVQALPTVIQSVCAALPQIINAVVSALLNMLPMLIDCGIQLFVALIEARSEICGALMDAMPELIESVIGALTALIPDLIACGFDLFVSLISNIGAAIAQIITAVPDVVDSIKNSFTDQFYKVREVGKNLIEGLWNGIQDMTQWIYDKISGFGEGILNGLKSFFGIASPSRVLRDQIGKNLALGVAAGIADEADTAVSAMEHMADDIADVDFSRKTPEFDFPTYADAESNPLAFERNIRTTFGAVPDQTVIFDSGLMARLDSILTAIERGQVLLLDGDQIVGGTLDKYNHALGELQAMSARGVQ